MTIRGALRDLRDRMKVKLEAIMPGNDGARNRSSPDPASPSQEATDFNASTALPPNGPLSPINSSTMYQESAGVGIHLARDHAADKPGHPGWRATAYADVVQTSDGSWRVHGVGVFRNRAHYSFEDGTLPRDLQPSNAKIGGSVAPLRFGIQYQTANVDMMGGYLNLRVPGGQHPEALDNTVGCAQVETVKNTILYASVRTNAIFSSVSGSCHGMFFYRDDRHEIDIEYITDPDSGANPGDGKPPTVHFTNQPLCAGVRELSTAVTAPNLVTQVHEYRTDWIPGKTMFYIDRKLVTTFTENVPDMPGRWIWNNWCNGNPNWSCGPPQQDNIFKIQDITMYYNVSPIGK